MSFGTLADRGFLVWALGGRIQEFDTSMVNTGPHGTISSEAKMLSLRRTPNEESIVKAEVHSKCCPFVESKISLFDFPF